jgi:F0F1-type ATP synthase assembly protein I
LPYFAKFFTKWALMSAPAPPNRQDDDRVRRQLLSLSGVGMEFLAAVLLCTGVGWWIDSRAGSGPWGTVAGAGFGFVVGLYLLIKSAGNLDRK